MFQRGEIDWKIKRNKMERIWRYCAPSARYRPFYAPVQAKRGRAECEGRTTGNRGGRRKGPGREPPGYTTGGKCSRIRRPNHDGLSRAGGHSARALARRAGEARRSVSHRRQLHRYRPERLDGSTSRGPRGRGGNGLGAAPRPEVARGWSAATARQGRCGEAPQGRPPT